MNESSLEDCYRRILRWYPAEHRREHEDEMIGVLLAKARPGQSRPDFRDLCDLARGALLIRTRRATCALSQERWRDGFAIVAVVAPILLLGYSLFMLLGSANNLLTFTEPGLVRHEWQNALKDTLENDVVWVAWTAVAVLAPFGLRRAGALGALVVPLISIGLVLASLVVPLTSLGLIPGWFYPLGVVYWLNADFELPVVLSLLTAVALWVSPGVGRGYHLLGKGRLILVVALTVGFTEPSIQLMYHGLRGDGVFVFHTDTPPSFLKPVLVIAAVAGAVSLMRSAVGRSACALLAIPLVCTLYANDPAGVTATPFRLAVYLIAVPLLGFAVVRYGARLLERAVRR